MSSSPTICTISRTNLLKEIMKNGGIEMAKKGLSDAQFRRVNRLSFELSDYFEGISSEDYPGFLKRANLKAENGIDIAVSAALKAIYLPDSEHKDDLVELIMFMISMCDRYCPLILDGTATRRTIRDYGTLSGCFMQICDMAAKKGIRSPKKSMTGS